jgi:heme/copper-type cytochrome/quinol oxidase subunit 2
MSIISIAAETVEHTIGLEVYIPPAIALVVLLVLGVVVWSYRDVSNRQAPQAKDGHDAHSAGH